jgi:DNA repair exonuclease SbcCD nuclease subunit
MVKLVHTADIHIGKVFEQFGTFGGQLRTQIKSTFRNVMQLALSEAADAILISGDLFDASSPSPADIRFFMEAVQIAKPTPVYLLPGTWTHDGFLKNYFYRSSLFLNNRPENLFVFSSEQPETFKLHSRSVAIHGRAVLPESGNPVDGMKADPEMAFNVGMLHTGIALPQLPDGLEQASLTRNQVDQSSMDYLAMGHWHVFRRYFDDSKTVVQYSGSPETLQFKDGEDSGLVAVVTLDNGRVLVEPRRVGHYRWMEQGVDCSGLASNASITEEILKHADANRILRVTLRGTLASKESVNLERIYEDLSPKFAYLDLDATQLNEDLALGALEKEYRENTVEHAFVELMEQALQDTKDASHKEILRESLRRGHKLFQGYEGISI